MTKDLITIDSLSKVYDNGFNALKTVYISLNNLGFENLDIYSE